MPDLLDGPSEARRHLLFEFHMLIRVFIHELGTCPLDPGRNRLPVVQVESSNFSIHHHLLTATSCCSRVYTMEMRGRGPVMEEEEGTEGRWGVYELTWYIELSERPLSWGVAVRSVDRVQMKSGRCYVRLDVIQALQWDSLNNLHIQLHVKSRLRTFKNRNVHHQKGNTHAQHKIQANEIKIVSLAEKYRTAQHAKLLQWQS
ncbi:hypothetical protein K474DRAFT_1680961 [Panus rudis PR-1116 ss-1]|nr:hypothetical protein K474DRAFT_1680961 [Panus rudis PR-1116 ss-1]